MIKFQEPVIKYIIRNSDAVIVPNEYEKKIFLQFCENEKIYIVRNGVDLEKLKISGFNFKKHYKISTDFLLFLGRFHYVKGVDILLEAFKQIMGNPLLKNITLVIMGVDFGYEEKMNSIIQKLKISEKVVVIKNPPREHVLAAYNEAEFLILPSRWELSPLTPLEGFAFRKTVISTNTHGIPFTLEGNVNSLLVENESSKEVGDAILELLRDKLKRDRLAESGYMFVKNIANSDNMVDGIFQIYNKVLNK